MGMRDINIIYQKLLPRASNYIIGLHICTTGIVRMQIDGLTHVIGLYICTIGIVCMQIDGLTHVEVL